MTNNLYIALAQRSVIQIEGEDAKTFLQGLLTNDINKVDENNVIYALMLTPQGKFLYDFFVAQREGAYLLDCRAEDIQKIIKKLSMYRLRSDVQISDVSEKYEVAALIGEKVFEVMEDGEQKVRQFCKGVAYIDPRTDKIYGRSFIEKENEYQSFKAFDFEQGSDEDYHYARVSAGVPEGGIDIISEKDFPHDFGMDDLNAVDYKKGCYVGQEVTARVHHKGSVRKGLYVLDTQAQGDVEPDSDVCIDGEKIGKLLSLTNDVALALLIKEKVEKDNITCSVNGIEYKVRS